MLCTCLLRFLNWAAAACDDVVYVDRFEFLPWLYNPLRSVSRGIWDYDINHPSVALQLAACQQSLEVLVHSHHQLSGFWFNFYVPSAEFNHRPKHCAVCEAKQSCIQKKDWQHGNRASTTAACSPRCFS